MKRMYVFPMLAALFGWLMMSGCSDGKTEEEFDDVHPFKQLSTIIQQCNIGELPADSGNAMANRLAEHLMGRQLNVTGNPFRVKYKSAEIVSVTPNMGSKLVGIKFKFIPEEGYQYNLEEERGRMPLMCEYVGSNGEYIGLKKEVMTLEGRDLYMFIRVTENEDWHNVSALNLVAADGVEHVTARRMDMPNGDWMCGTMVEGYAEVTAHLFQTKKMGQCPSIPNRHSNGYIALTDEYYEGTAEYNLVYAEEERDGGFVYEIEYYSAPGILEIGKVLLTIEKDGDTEALLIKALDEKAKKMPADGLKFVKI